MHARPCALISARRFCAIPLTRVKSSKESKGRSSIIWAARLGPMCLIRSSRSAVAEFTSTWPLVQPSPPGGTVGVGVGTAVGAGVAVGTGTAVGVVVGVGTAVGVAVGTGTAVEVVGGVGTAVGVAMGTGTAVGVVGGVGTAVGVAVGTGAAVGVGVGTGSSWGGRGWKSWQRSNSHLGRWENRGRGGRG